MGVYYRQLLVALAEWLCANHRRDARAGRIVADMHLHILPTMNPDGFERRDRGNARGADLNRDFPDPIERGAAGVEEPSGTEQPETLAVMEWIRGGRFVASASLHEVGPCQPRVFRTGHGRHEWEAGGRPALLSCFLLAQ